MPIESRPLGVAGSADVAVVPAFPEKREKFEHFNFEDIYFWNKRRIISFKKYNDNFFSCTF